MLHTIRDMNPTRMNGVTAVLQDLHDNPQALDLARDRFDPDDPPPPYSSSGSTELPTPTLQVRRTPHEIAEILREPLDNVELHLFRRNLTAYPVFRQFRIDSRKERERIDEAWSRRDSNHRPTYRGPDLIGRPGTQREKVMSRNCVRKRWQALGVWNLAWGIPGRVPYSHEDDPMGWRWKWPTARKVRGHYHELSWEDQEESWPPEDEEYPDERAVRLYLEDKGRLPRTHRQPTPTHPDTNEFFITSRPWYRWELEVVEETTKLGRIPEFAGTRRNMAETNVRARWEMKGDWKDSWHDTPGWKWKHESASPEPEDPNDLDFSQSEVDALESIPPPTPPKPLYFEPVLTEEERRQARYLFGDLRGRHTEPEQSSSMQSSGDQSKEDGTVNDTAPTEDKLAEGVFHLPKSAASSPSQEPETSRATVRSQRSSFQEGSSNSMNDKPRLTSPSAPHTDSSVVNPKLNRKRKRQDNNTSMGNASSTHFNVFPEPRQQKRSRTASPPPRCPSGKKASRHIKPNNQSQVINDPTCTVDKRQALKPRRSARIAKLPVVSYRE